MPNKEDLITTAFVNVLRPMRHGWTLIQHPSKPFVENNKEPDIIVTEPKRNPIVIEDKVDHKRGADLSGEKQLKDDYLGKTLKTIGHTIHTGIAVRFPYRFRIMDQAELNVRMNEAEDITYCLLSTGEPHRFPKEGWLTGSVTDIATAIRVGATPISKIEEAVQTLKNGVNYAAMCAQESINERPDLGKKIAKILHQQPSKQTIQMAMLIIGNAFVFQSLIAHKPDLEAIPSLSEIKEEYGKLSASEVLKIWKHIQEINYTPIFGVADLLVRVLQGDDQLVGNVLHILQKTAINLQNMGLAQEHEIAGIAFQEFIQDRKIIKANYTRPESSLLLCSLVLPQLKKDANDIKVADFACGTGTLLNGIYQRILTFHEQSGGRGMDIHKHMVENNLLGCDILPNATHLTVSIIAGTYPNIRIGDTRIKTMPYGTPHGDGKYAIGALDLLGSPEQATLLDLEKVEAVTGTGTRTEELHRHFKPHEFDIVIQNPPFTKTSADNNSSSTKSIFGDHPNKDKMRKSLKAYKSQIGNNHAGLGSYFIDVADKMLKTEGRMGIVLPTTVLSSSSWRKIRQLFANEYHDLVVVSIAAEKTEYSVFSADTSMTECLIIAQRGKTKKSGRGTFICLHRQPIVKLEAVEIAKEISKLKDIPKIESGITGGNPIKVGKETIGYAQNCPLTPINGVWSVFCVKDLTVAQSAFHLVNGQLQLPRQGATELIPICRLSEIARIGSRIYDMKGKNKKRIVKIEEGCHETVDYPCIWHVHNETQQSMVVQPNAHALLRSTVTDDIEKLERQNSRTHYNMFLRYNTNSLTVMSTEQKTLGVNLIPSILFENQDYEYVWTLWGNSTLGLLCHWMNSSKQHLGRGIYARTDLRSLPTLDVRQLSQFQLIAAETIYHDLKSTPMLPFYKLKDDQARIELDRRLLSEVLGFEQKKHQKVHDGIALLREKLCQEPSIHGGIDDSNCNSESEKHTINNQNEDGDTIQSDLFS